MEELNELLQTKWYINPNKDMVINSERRIMLSEQDQIEIIDELTFIALKLKEPSKLEKLMYSILTNKI